MKPKKLRPEPKVETSNTPLENLSAILGESQLGFFKDIIEKQDTALSVRNKDFKPLYANPAFFRIFGLTHEEWKQDNWSQSFSSDSIAVVLDEAIPQAIAGEKWCGEFEIVTLEGETKLVEAEWAGVFDEKGIVTCFYGFYKEVTSLRFFESELKKQNDFLNEIIDTVPDPLTVKNQDHIWVAVNRAFCKLTGLTREELLGKSVYDHFPKEEADVFWEQDAIALNTDQEITNDESITCRGGKKCQLSRKRVTISRSDGEKILISIARDITDQRQLEKTVADTYNQLEAGLNALKHDLSGLKSCVESGESRAEAIRGLLETCNRKFSGYMKETGLKAKPERIPDFASPNLSAREFQVFMLLVQGRRLKEIADHLGISANTSSTYRRRILKKLELKSMSDMVQYAIRHGLI